MEMIEARTAFLIENKVQDFDRFPFVQKLAICQKVEDRYIKRRKIGNIMMPYLPHTMAEKILNFVFGFRISSEVISTEVVKGMQQVNEYGAQNEVIGKKEVVTYDAKALVKFTFSFPADEKGNVTTITRTVLGTHKTFDNPAASRHEAEKSAISKAWTVVAKTFGIGTDLERKEEEALKRASKYTPPAAKSFSNHDF